MMTLRIIYSMAAFVFLSGCSQATGPETEHHHDQPNEHNYSSHNEHGHGSHDEHQCNSHGEHDQGSQEGCGCQDEHGQDEHGHGSHEGCSSHGEHGHESGSHGRGALERIASMRCEHQVPILDCDQCRYEVGAVEVSPSLFDPDGDDLIRTAKLAKSAQPRNLDLTGEVAFDERRVAHVSPRVGGIVRRAFVTVGDQVERGAKLIVMDSLELGQLRSRYLQARARLELAQKNFDRQQKLHERRIASGQEKLQAETTFREATIELESAREQLRLLGLSGRGLDRAGAKRIHGGATLLTAPISGTVVSMHAVNGERVSPEESVVTIADLTKIWVWADVYERDLGGLISASEGTQLRATVKTAAFSGRSFEGHVDYVGAIMEEATRTVKARVKVDNEQKLLRPGMFVNVSVEVGQGSDVLSLPTEAVMEHEDRAFVFVKIGPRRFLRRDVTYRPIGSDRVAILSGAEIGEEIVVRGAFLLKSDVLREQMGAGCAH